MCSFYQEINKIREIICGPKEGRWVKGDHKGSKRRWPAADGGLLAGGVLGDGLGAFRDGVLGQLSGEDEADGGLDFARGDGALLVVVGETAGLGGDALEDVVDEGVHDGHGLGGDSGVGVDLLQDTVDVDGVALLPSLSLLLVSSGADLLGFGGLLGSLGGWLGWHVSCWLAR